ncbi:hypothetical protein B4N89_13475 [Embleya scabrispora]|uniref:Uncharacterized protein n=1 Tax=Embleya scabrispora TaxID=159449 RepID=A0A1T3NYR5_9ACTN|nr:hypothetical protein [Embleya scabrispora]OPC81811.1 hypothetical protein B4N89_13475 [Embleya scabrispora]
MTKMILLGVRAFAAGVDLTGASTKVEISAEVEDKDATTYGSGGWKEVLGGLSSAEIAAEGYWEAGDPSMVDDASWAQFGGIGPWTIGPAGAAVGDLAYFTQALRADYGLGDQVGEIAPWKGTAKSSWPLVRGSIAHPPGTARTVTGVGTAMQLGAVPAGKRLYAALHVLSVAGTAGPSITARVESDDAIGFPSPTTRATFTAATAPGGQTLRTDGTAITDTYYRLAWTITGTTPSFMLAAALGIR